MDPGTLLIPVQETTITSKGQWNAAYMKVGDTVQVDYSGLENSSFSGNKLKKVRYTYTLLATTHYDQSVIFQAIDDPTATAYVHNYHKDSRTTSSFEMEMRVQFFDEKDQEIIPSKENYALTSFASINSFEGQGEYVAGYNGKFLPINGSSISVRDQKAMNYSSVRQEDMAKGWDTTTSPDAYIGSIVGQSTEPIRFTFGNSNGFAYWFAFNSDVKAKGVLGPEPIKPQAPVREKVQLVKEPAIPQKPIKANGNSQAKPTPPTPPTKPSLATATKPLAPTKPREVKNPTEPTRVEKPAQPSPLVVLYHQSIYRPLAGGGHFTPPATIETKTPSRSGNSKPLNLPPIKLTPKNSPVVPDAQKRALSAILGSKESLEKLLQYSLPSRGGTHPNRPNPSPVQVTPIPRPTWTESRPSRPQVAPSFNYKVSAPTTPPRPVRANSQPSVKSWQHAKSPSLMKKEVREKQSGAFQKNLNIADAGMAQSVLDYMDYLVKELSKKHKGDQTKVNRDLAMMLAYENYSTDFLQKTLNQFVTPYEHDSKINSVRSITNNHESDSSTIDFAHVMTTLASLEKQDNPLNEMVKGGLSLKNPLFYLVLSRISPPLGMISMAHDFSNYDRNVILQLNSLVGDMFTSSSNKDVRSDMDAIILARHPRFKDLPLHERLKAYYGQSDLNSKRQTLFLEVYDKDSKKAGIKAAVEVLEASLSLGGMAALAYGVLRGIKDKRNPIKDIQENTKIMDEIALNGTLKRWGQSPWTGVKEISGVYIDRALAVGKILLGSINQSINKAVHTVKGAYKFVENKVSSAIKRVGNFFKPKPSPSTKNGAKLKQAAVATLGSSLKKVGTAFIQNITRPIQPFLQVAQKLAKPILQPLKKLTTQVVNQISQPFKKAGQMIQKAFQTPKKQTQSAKPTSKPVNKPATSRPTTKKPANKPATSRPTVKKSAPAKSNKKGKRK